MTPIERERYEAVLRRDGLKPDEVRAVMSQIVEGVMPKYEVGPCRHCDGQGSVMVPACMGSTFERCRHCYGNCTTSRIKVPNLPPSTRHGQEK